MAGEGLGEGQPGIRHRSGLLTLRSRQLLLDGLDLLVLTALFVCLTQFQIQLANLRLRLNASQRRILSYLARPFEMHNRLARRSQAEGFLSCDQAAAESCRLFSGR